jgi:hypothetical protein
LNTENGLSRQLSRRKNGGPDDSRVSMSPLAWDIALIPLVNTEQRNATTARTLLAGGDTSDAITINVW